VPRKKPQDLTRRKFLGATIGTAVAASIGCSSEPKTDAGIGSNGGGPGATGQGGNSGQGGGSSTGQGGASTVLGGGPATSQGGSTAPSQGGASLGQGGTSGGTTSVGAGGTSAPNGGASTAQTGGASNLGGSSSGGAQIRGGSAGTSGGSSTVTAGSTAKGGSSGKGGSSAAAGSSAKGGSTATAGSFSSGGASSTDTPLVAMVRGTDWVQATIDAIALAGGLPDLSGKTVLLKPNIISADADATTNVDVIHGVIKAAKAKNAKRIIVADAAWGGTTGVSSDVVANMKSLGITAMCTAEGAETLDLRSDSHTTRSNPNASAFPNGIDFSDAVYDADYVINVPACKCHSVGKYTMALKAWYGCTESGRPHSNTWVAPAELHLLKQEGFIVLDATKAMITGGPSSGTMAQSKIVVASKDAVAIDVTGLCILKYNGSSVIANKGDAWNVHQIKRALALKFPGWLSSAQAFSYAQTGVTEHADIMALRMA
jgi:uncharacterized protein (DUF362 family)